MCVWGGWQALELLLVDRWGFWPLPLCFQLMGLILGCVLLVRLRSWISRSAPQRPPRSRACPVTARSSTCPRCGDLRDDPEEAWFELPGGHQVCPSCVHRAGGEALVEWLRSMPGLRDHNRPPLRTFLAAHWWLLTITVCFFPLAGLFLLSLLGPRSVGDLLVALAVASGPLLLSVASLLLVWRGRREGHVVEIDAGVLRERMGGRVLRWFPLSSICEVDRQRRIVRREQTPTELVVGLLSPVEPGVIRLHGPRADQLTGLLWLLQALPA
jgi:hypothetical protein